MMATTFGTRSCISEYWTKTEYIRIGFDIQLWISKKGPVYDEKSCGGQIGRMKICLDIFKKDFGTELFEDAGEKNW